MVTKFIAWCQQKTRKFMVGVAGHLNSLSGGKITPNTVTYIGFFAHIPIAILIARGNNIFAGGLLVVFGLFDTLDGALARVQQKESPKGMFLDSLTDRLKEIALYLGATWLAQERWQYIVIVSGVSASLCVTYINAWGEVVLAKASIKNDRPNKLLRTGIASYDVRISIIIIGLFTNRIFEALVAVIILSIWTIFVRTANVLSRLRR